jgi:hypothetical protein
MKSFVKWLESTNYQKSILDILTSKYNIDSYDATQLIAKKAIAIQADERNQTPPETAAFTLNRIWLHQNDAQNHRDAQRQLSQDQQLVGDIRNGKRPGPPIASPTPELRSQLNTVLDNKPKIW